MFHKKGGIHLEKEQGASMFPSNPPNPPLKKAGKKDKFRKGGKEERIFS
ncbi:MAG: hypothetical protein JETT_1260 [Candidatus Jettenia ecosi]|uniref:Uncharacterized protein n=1 Tax=Candidatus Jettenia ecosi TaxID=2494326 RepID=A0A533QCF7_9BACT|nr:MAG: hypothetical protein JETT_1260 [Candidatus Jettenia ecosi]